MEQIWLEIYKKPSKYLRYNEDLNLDGKGREVVSNLMHYVWWGSGEGISNELKKSIVEFNNSHLREALIKNSDFVGGPQRGVDQYLRRLSKGDLVKRIKGVGGIDLDKVLRKTEKDKIDPGQWELSLFQEAPVRHFGREVSESAHEGEARRIKGLVAKDMGELSSYLQMTGTYSYLYPPNFPYLLKVGMYPLVPVSRLQYFQRGQMLESMMKDYEGRKRSVKFKNHLYAIEELSLRKKLTYYSEKLLPKIEIWYCDTVVAGYILQCDGYNPAIHNMAASRYPGGGVKDEVNPPPNAQEEDLARRGGLVPHLSMFIDNTYGDDTPYLIPLEGASVSKDVIFFRDTRDTGYKMLTEPINLSVVSSAALNFSRGTNEAGVFIQGRHSTVDNSSKIHEAITKNKMRTTILVGKYTDCDALVFSPFGTGAFNNREDDIYRWFEEVLDEGILHSGGIKYRQLYKKIIIATQDPTAPKDQVNEEYDKLRRTYFNAESGHEEYVQHSEKNVRSIESYNKIFRARGHVSSALELTPNLLTNGGDISCEMLCLGGESKQLFVTSDRSVDMLIGEHLSHSILHVFSRKCEWVREGGFLQLRWKDGSVVHDDLRNGIIVPDYRKIREYYDIPEELLDDGGEDIQRIEELVLKINSSIDQLKKK